MFLDYKTLNFINQIPSSSTRNNSLKHRLVQSNTPIEKQELLSNVICFQSSDSPTTNLNNPSLYVVYELDKVFLCKLFTSDADINSDSYNFGGKKQINKLQKKLFIPLKPLIEKNPNYVQSFATLLPKNSVYLKNLDNKELHQNLFVFKKNTPSKLYIR